jgi:hypothetical protein
VDGLGGLTAGGAPLKGLMVSLRPVEVGLMTFRARFPTPEPSPRLAHSSIFFFFEIQKQKN